MEDKGLRFNEGKIRYDLIEPYAVEQLAKVFTKGAEKYAVRNWEGGMKWSKMIASLKRHIAAYEKGEDFDQESGLYHMAHAAWNAMALISYYKLYPQGDDRQNYQLGGLRIGLDIDEVLCDFTKGWSKVYNDVDERPTTWYYDRQMMARFQKMKEDGTLDDFYLGLEPKLSQKDIPFEPACYVTSRPVDSIVTEEWLDTYGFPRAKVYTVGLGQSKVECLKEAKVDIFIDDSYSNFLALNKAGILCYLYDAPHNQRFNVGHKRIFTLTDLIR
jgi:hypothetical protein